MKCCNTSVYDLRAGRDLYRAVPALTRGLDLHGLSRRTVPFIYLLRQAWVTESLLRRGDRVTIITIKSENGTAFKPFMGSNIYKTRDSTATSLT